MSDNYLWYSGMDANHEIVASIGIPIDDPLALSEPVDPEIEQVKLSLMSMEELEAA